jgi:Ran-binding protein 9/10
MTYYPNLLEDNPNIAFRLRCRKFVEMMRQSHEPPSKSRPAPTNGHGASEEIFTQEMELDEPPDVPDDWDRMDTEDGRTNGVTPGDRMRETMEYGTILSQQYRDDRTKDQALKEIFSLFAYQDLKNSPAGPILDVGGRIPVAEELNSAILGK